MVAPVSRFQIMLGRTLGGATVAILQGMIVFLVSLLVGFRPYSLAALGLAFLVVVLIAILFTAFGTAVASLLEDMQGFQLIMNFLVMPLFFLSGALFPLVGLPKVISTIVRIDPLSYGVDGLRSALLGTNHLGLTTDLVVLSVGVVLLMGIGSFLFSKLEV